VIFGALFTIGSRGREVKRDAGLSRNAVYAANRKAMSMNRARGVVLLAAGVLALWKGWMIHRGQMAVLAYMLGVLALALSIWHLTRRAAPPRA